MTIIEAKRKYESVWLTMEGVISVGIGQGANGTAAIRIGLDKKRTATIRQIPTVVEGFPVEIEITGSIKPL